jgi:hypothetical protein
MGDGKDGRERDIGGARRFGKRGEETNEQREESRTANGEGKR